MVAQSSRAVSPRARSDHKARTSRACGTARRRAPRGPACHGVSGVSHCTRRQSQHSGPQSVSKCRLAPRSCTDQEAPCGSVSEGRGCHASQLRWRLHGSSPAHAARASQRVRPTELVSADDPPNQNGTASHHTQAAHSEHYNYSCMRRDLSGTRGRLPLDHIGRRHIEEREVGAQIIALHSGRVRTWLGPQRLVWKLWREVRVGKVVHFLQTRRWRRAAR
jgi:hypothetical protein